MWRSVRNLAQHVLARSPERWRPLLAVYYLTYACDFRCPYCSDGAQNPYYALRSRLLRGDELLELLAILRRATDFLILTGGEPTKHPDFAWLMERLPALGFDGVVLTTNGYELGPHLEQTVRAVRHLVFSLDTLDAARADACYGVAGALERILATLERALPLARRAGCEVVISAVATPDNLDDLHGVYDFARERGLRFALCPQLVGVKPHAELRQNPRYRALYDRLIAEKRAGQKVQGAIPYLEHMRDLRKFRCRPSTMVAVTPVGDVFYPCLELGHVAGNLRTTPDLDALRVAGRAEFGPEPSCDNRCHSACALGFAMMLERPLAQLEELVLEAKGHLLGRR
jgi:MoaA/NifB/PqqE/SkfB family radical SAM enzyme